MTDIQFAERPSNPTQSHDHNPTHVNSVVTQDQTFGMDGGENGSTTKTTSIVSICHENFQRLNASMKRKPNKGRRFRFSSTSSSATKDADMNKDELVMLMLEGDHRFEHCNYDLALRSYRLALDLAKSMSPSKVRGRDRDRDNTTHTVTNDAEMPSLCSLSSSEASSSSSSEECDDESSGLLRFPSKDFFRRKNSVEQTDLYVAQITSLLNFKMGHCHYFRGDFDDAAALLKQSVNFFENSSTDKTLIEVVTQSVAELDRATVMTRTVSSDIIKGRQAESSGKYVDADACYAKALIALRKAVGPVHPLLASTLTKRGIVQWKSGRYAEAKINLDEAQVICRSAFGDFDREDGSAHGHLLHADVCAGMGSVHLAMGEYTEALECYESSLKQRRRWLGTDHPDVARAMIRVGMIHDEQGRSEKAMALYREGLAVQRRVLGDDHVDVAATLLSMGVVHEKLTDYQQALNVYQEAHRIYVKELGPHHVDVAVTLNNLGDIYRKVRDEETAMSFYTRALNVMTTCVGRNHRNVAGILHNIALLHSRREEYNEALDLFRKVLAMQRAALSDEHPDVAVTLSDMGEVYEKRGFAQMEERQRRDKYEKAAKLYKKALRVRRVALGSSHFFVGVTLSRLGGFYMQKLVDPVEAYRRYHEALEIYRLHDLSTEHPFVQEAIRCLQVLRLQQPISRNIPIQSKDYHRRMSSKYSDDEDELC